MAKMRAIAPRIKNIQERYKDDREQLAKQMMEIYKREKINPVAGCLPILVQIPVFLAFYWVLLESVEMRQAPFFGWIQDLSSKDPFFILPILMGIAMFGQFKLNPAPPDPMQAKMFAFMPVVMTVMMAWFPAGSGAVLAHQHAAFDRAAMAHQPRGRGGDPDGQVGGLNRPGPFTTRSVLDVAIATSRRRMCVWSEPVHRRTARQRPGRLGIAAAQRRPDASAGQSRQGTRPHPGRPGRDRWSRPHGAESRRIEPQSKSGELALLVVRAYRALYVLVGGEARQMKHWMHTAEPSCRWCPGRADAHGAGPDARRRIPRRNTRSCLTDIWAACSAARCPREAGRHRSSAGRKPGAGRDQFARAHAR